MVHLFLILAISAEAVDGAMAAVKILGRDVNDIRKVIIGIETVIATMVFLGTISLSLFATASLVPTMLEKGSIELLISKPLSRTQLLVGRFIGAQSVMLFNVTYLVGGTWLILSLKTGIWYFPYLYSIPMVSAVFAIMYAFMAFAGVTSRSSGVSVMVAFTVVIVSSLLVQADRIYNLLPKFYSSLLKGLYHALPKTATLVELNKSLVMGEPIAAWSALWTSGIAGAVMLLAAIFVFSRKDF